MVWPTQCSPPASPECTNRIAAWAGAIDVAGFDITADADGGVLLTGSFTRTIDFDPTEGVDERGPTGDHDMFVTKLRADGSYAWTRTVGGMDSFRDGASGKGVTTMANGDILIAGSFRGTADFDPTDGVDERTAEEGFFRGYVLALLTDGTYGWTITFAEGVGDTFGSRVARGPDQSILITGAFSGELDFDPGTQVATHTSAGSRDIFVMKLFGDGSYAWTRTFGGTGLDQGTGIAVALDGNILITGTFQGSADFDPTEGIDVHFAVGSRVDNVFVTKLHDDGSYGWTRTLPAFFSGFRGTIAVDSQGSAVITGGFKGTVDLDPTAGVDLRTAVGDPERGDIFVTKLNADGSYAWTVTVGGANSDIGRGVAVDAGGNVLVTGQFHETVDFDPGPGVDLHTAHAVADAAFVMKLGPDGSYKWTRTFGEQFFTEGQYVAMDGDGAAMLLGSFRQTVDIDPGCGVDEISTVDGSADTFVVKLICVEPTGDSDGNGTVDLGDFARFQNCFSGEAPAICPNGCELFDFDARDDITLFDLGALIDNLTGP